MKARFDGGKLTSDGGVLLLREVEKRTGLIDGFAECFADHRDPRLIEHTVKDLVGQRVYGLCLGYEDLNDHDQLRADPTLAVALDKADPLGNTRRQTVDRWKALAAKCTLKGSGADRIVGAIRFRSTPRRCGLCCHDVTPDHGGIRLPWDRNCELALVNLLR